MACKTNLNPDETQGIRLHKKVKRSSIWQKLRPDEGGRTAARFDSDLLVFLGDFFC